MRNSKGEANLGVGLLFLVFLMMGWELGGGNTQKTTEQRCLANL